MSTAEDKLKGPSRKKPREKKVEQILRLPFCTDQLRVIVNRIVRRSKLPIKVIHVNGASIKQRWFGLRFSHLLDSIATLNGQVEGDEIARRMTA